MDNNKKTENWAATPDIWGITETETLSRRVHSFINEVPELSRDNIADMVFDVYCMLGALTTSGDRRDRIIEGVRLRLSNLTKRIDENITLATKCMIDGLLESVLVLFSSPTLDSRTCIAAVAYLCRCVKSIIKHEHETFNESVYSKVFATASLVISKFDELGIEIKNNNTLEKCIVLTAAFSLIIDTVEDRTTRYELCNIIERNIKQAKSVISEIEEHRTTEVTENTSILTYKICASYVLQISEEILNECKHNGTLLLHDNSIKRLALLSATYLTHALRKIVDKREERTVTKIKDLAATATENLSKMKWHKTENSKDFSMQSEKYLTAATRSLCQLEFEIDRLKEQKENFSKCSLWIRTTRYVVPPFSMSMLFVMSCIAHVAIAACFFCSEGITNECINIADEKPNHSADHITILTATFLEQLMNAHVAKRPFYKDLSKTIQGELVNETTAFIVKPVSQETQSKVPYSYIHWLIFSTEKPIARDMKYAIHRVANTLDRIETVGSSKEIIDKSVKPAVTALKHEFTVLQKPMISCIPYLRRIENHILDAVIPLAADLDFAHRPTTASTEYHLVAIIVDLRRLARYVLRMRETHDEKRYDASLDPLKAVAYEVVTISKYLQNKGVSGILITRACAISALIGITRDVQKTKRTEVLVKLLSTKIEETAHFTQWLLYTNTREKKCLVRYATVHYTCQHAIAQLGQHSQCDTWNSWIWRAQGEIESSTDLIAELLKTTSGLPGSCKKDLKEIQHELSKFAVKICDAFDGKVNRSSLREKSFKLSMLFADFSIKLSDGIDVPGIVPILLHRSFVACHNVYSQSKSLGITPAIEENVLKVAHNAWMPSNPMNCSGTSKSYIAMERSIENAPNTVFTSTAVTNTYRHLTLWNGPTQ